MKEFLLHIASPAFLCSLGVGAGGQVGMLRAQRLFPDRQRTPVKRLGLRVLALGTIKHRQVVEAGGYVEVLPAPRLFPDR
jgi:hypothetical protein